MKTAGIIGGMSWESSAVYYQLINKEIKNRLGGLHSAKIILNSLDFFEVEKMQSAGQWDKMESLMAAEARKLQKAGADFIMIGTNTMHKTAPFVEKSVDLPLLHIADATAKVIQKSGFDSVGLLGTRFTMEEEFYSDRLNKNFGIKVIIPSPNERQFVDRTIYEELCLGQFSKKSKKQFIEIIENLTAEGADGIILGCTEIPLLIKSEDMEIPLFNTMEIHARAAVDLMLEN